MQRYSVRKCTCSVCIGRDPSNYPTYNPTPRNHSNTHNTLRTRRSSTGSFNYLSSHDTENRHHNYIRQVSAQSHHNHHHNIPPPQPCRNSPAQGKRRAFNSSQASESRVARSVDLDPYPSSYARASASTPGLESRLLRSVDLEPYPSTYRGTSSSTPGLESRVSIFSNDLDPGYDPDTLTQHQHKHHQLLYMNGWVDEHGVTHERNGYGYEGQIEHSRSGGVNEHVNHTHINDQRELNGHLYDGHNDNIMNDVMADHALNSYKDNRVHQGHYSMIGGQLQDSEGMEEMHVEYMNTNDGHVLHNHNSAVNGGNLSKSQVMHCLPC